MASLEQFAAYLGSGNEEMLHEIYSASVAELPEILRMLDTVVVQHRYTVVYTAFLVWQKHGDADEMSYRKYVHKTMEELRDALASEDAALKESCVARIQSLNQKFIGGTCAEVMEDHAEVLAEVMAEDYALGYELQPSGPDPSRDPFGMDDTIALLQNVTLEDPMKVLWDVPGHVVLFGSNIFWSSWVHTSSLVARSVGMDGPTDRWGDRRTGGRSDGGRFDGWTAIQKVDERLHATRSNQ